MTEGLIANQIDWTQPGAMARWKNQVAAAKALRETTRISAMDRAVSEFDAAAARLPCRLAKDEARRIGAWPCRADLANRHDARPTRRRGASIYARWRRRFGQEGE